MPVQELISSLYKKLKQIDQKTPKPKRRMDKENPWKKSAKEVVLKCLASPVIKTYVLKSDILFSD